MRRWTRLPAAALCLALLGSCQVAPGTGRQGFNIMSSEQEQQMGADSHPAILKEFGGAYDDPKVQAYVAGIGQRLVKQTETPEATFRFTVLNSDIVNAMALPGGYVYVTRGLLALAADEAELAGVVGHEIGHVTGRHTAERYSRAVAANVLLGVLGAVVGTPGVADVAQLGAAAYLQSYSRDQESEADSLGLRYMTKAGWDPEAMPAFLEKLHQQSRLEAILAGRPADSVDQYNMMASHPRTIDRVQAAAQEAQAAHTKGAMGRDLYLAQIEGLTYGDDPSEGVVRNRVFSHPDLGIRFEVPPGFRLVNGAKAVTATHQDGSQIRFDMGSGAKAGMAAYMQYQWAKGIRLSNIETIDVGGHEAATASARVNTNHGAMDLRLVAIAGGGGRAWRFMFLTPPNRTAGHDEELRRATYSFRSLTPEERAAIRPLRVHVVTVKPGDTVEGLAERMPFEHHRLERFQVLNGLEPGQQLKPGQKIKLVVG
ncbi:MAG: M48 family metalloprotease [Actinomycetota bacterium]